jgi:putative DNA primase/helicase
MTAEEIANVLRGRKSGNGFKACCPAHEDHQPSLSIHQGRDGRVLVRCHAGCEQRQVISALESRGLWDRHGQQSSGCSAPTFVSRQDLYHEDAARTERALSIWKSAAPAEGTPVKTYLASRGITIAPPPSLRFHAGLKHPSGAFWPTMVAVITAGAANAPLAVHRTFLAQDGKGKAQVSPARMMLAPCRGGAVRLADIQQDQWLVIAEGIETTLAVMQACSLPGWAALSAGGITSSFHLKRPWC